MLSAPAATPAVLRIEAREDLVVARAVAGRSSGLSVSRPGLQLSGQLGERPWRGAVRAAAGRERRERQRVVGRATVEADAAGQLGQGREIGQLSLDEGPASRPRRGRARPARRRRRASGPAFRASPSGTRPRTRAGRPARPGRPRTRRARRARSRMSLSVWPRPKCVSSTFRSPSSSETPSRNVLLGGVIRVSVYSWATSGMAAARANWVVRAVGPKPGRALLVAPDLGRQEGVVAEGVVVVVVGVGDEQTVGGDPVDLVAAARGPGAPSRACRRPAPLRRPRRGRSSR